MYKSRSRMCWNAHVEKTKLVDSGTAGVHDKIGAADMSTGYRLDVHIGIKGPSKGGDIL
jgi:hypothetical protein